MASITTLFGTALLTAMSASLVALSLLSACSSGGGGAGSADAGERPSTTSSANDTSLCASVTKSVMETCPGHAPAIDPKCTAYDRCVAGCVLSNMCNQSASSSCAARCVSSPSPTSSSSSSPNPSSSTSPSPSGSASTDPPYPQCVGYADSMCKCYPAGARTQCASNERLTCETYFSTCPSKTDAYYACAVSHLDCNNGNSLDACSQSSQSGPCN